MWNANPANGINVLSFLKLGTSLTELILSYSISSLRPVLASFPFLSIQLCVDSYNNFHFDPKLNLSLGIPKLLKDCPIYLLKDEIRFCGAMTTVQRAANSFYPDPENSFCVPRMDFYSLMKFHFQGTDGEGFILKESLRGD